jgi:serpin B
MNRILPTLVLATSSLASAASLAATPSAAPAGATRGDAFAADLFDRWCDGTANVVYSPYSLSAALGMVAAGGRGETAGQIAATLRAGVPAEGLPAHFAALDDRFAAARQTGVQLNIANSLWPQQDFAFQPAYLEIVRKQFRGEATPVDYVRQTEVARTTINRWVADRTANRIKDLIAPGILDAATRMTLVNAVYFKGKWAKPFDATRTTEEPFFGAGGSKPARLMFQKAKFRYAEADGIQALELPYIGGKLAMLVLLPAREKGLRQVAGVVKAEGTAKWDAALAEREVNVYLPKYTFTFERSCADTLKAMGIENAFDAGRADFSGMAGKPGDLVLSAVLHKAFIEVAEEGTEAAAATAGVMALTAFMPPNPPTLFRADHPFVFLIRERESGCILFMGAVAQPK